jgi:kinesin family member 20
MDFQPSKKKKKLDFDRETFARGSKFEFKVPMRVQQNSLADDEASDNDSEYSTTSTAVKETVNVYLRLKPTAEQVPASYQFNEETVVVKGNDSNQHTTTDRQFTFTSVLDQSVDQKTVYENCARPLLFEPFASAGAVIASYGISNSGKTHTILGGQTRPGLVPRALSQVFTEYEGHIASFPCIKIVNDNVSILTDDEAGIEIEATHDFLTESRKLNKANLTCEKWNDLIKADHDFVPKDIPDHQRIYVWVSFMEIYNEKIIDLLRLEKSNTGTKNRPLKIISNSGNSYVLGLTWLHVPDIKSALELLQHGLRRVNYAATGMNAHSSRSHIIFTMTIISESLSNYEFSSFKFCDLAGAERISKTGNVGDRLKEAGGINTSLLVLGRCLEAVQSNQKNDKKEIVPVRESKLTLMLQNSLMGRENFVMIVNLLPTVDCLEENINVLHFGSIAHKIVIRKAETSRYRRSSRYTFFMNHVVRSPKMNSSLLMEESV